MKLAVCRGIVEAHGGRIRAESDGPGLETRLIFTLPVSDHSAPSPARRRPSGVRRSPGQGRILAVDEDQQMLWYLRNVLAEAGYTPTVTWDPEEAERVIAAQRPHLVLLDLALPGADGSGLMRRVQEVTDAPVVLLSGEGREQDVALAFEMGAEDYIVKPFSPAELVARVGAALRRRESAGRGAPRESFRLRELAIDYDRRRVTVGGEPAVLTDTEYRLLYELSVNAGRVLSREHLMNRVWSTREPGDYQVVRAYVKRLRRKLGETAANPRYIFNEPKMGYRLGRDEELAPESP